MSGINVEIQATFVGFHDACVVIEASSKPLRELCEPFTRLYTSETHEAFFVVSYMQSGKLKTKLIGLSQWCEFAIHIMQDMDRTERLAHTAPIYLLLNFPDFEG